MRVYIIKPVLTLGSDEQAHKFYGFCLDELNRHAETRVIQNDMNLIQSTGQPTERDIVIFLIVLIITTLQYLISFLAKGCILA